MSASGMSVVVMVLIMPIAIRDMTVTI